MADPDIWAMHYSAVLMLWMIGVGVIVMPFVVWHEELVEAGFWYSVFSYLRHTRRKFVKRVNRALDLLLIALFVIAAITCIGAIVATLLWGSLFLGAWVDAGDTLYISD